MSEEKNVAVQVAKERSTDEQEEIRVLSTGYRIKMNAVSASLIDEVQAKVKDPKIPTFFNEEKGREEENPSDPEYLDALKESERKRMNAVLDTLVLFGVDLIDGIPEDNTWTNKLKFMERRCQLDLSEFDLDDPFDKEFVFKKYIAVGANDLIEIGKKAGLRGKQIADAAKTFQN